MFEAWGRIVFLSRTPGQGDHDEPALAVGDVRVIVWVFQQGHLSGLLQFTPTGTIDPTMPILMPAIIFGLSTDYEVFLLTEAGAEPPTAVVPL